MVDKSPIEAAIDLKQSIKDFVSPTVAATIGEFVAATPGDLPRFLRPYQAAYRRACDIYASTGVFGSFLGGVDVIYDPACGDYLGADLPQYQVSDGLGFTGGQCAIAYSYVITYFSTPPGGTERQDGPVATGTVTGPIRKVNSGFPDPTSVGLGFKNGAGAFFSFRVTSPINASSFRSTETFTPLGGLPDNCGNFPGRVEGYPATRSGPPPASTLTFNDGDGPAVEIQVGVGNLDVDGTISFPINVGDVAIDIGGGTPTGGSDRTPTRRPDLDNPGEPIRPGDPGQPDDGVEVNEPLICFQVVITTVPPGASAEIGGEENIFIEGWNSDAGWARFILGLGTTTPIRLLSRVNTLCYCCGDVVAAGVQVKFSYGFTGYVVVYPIIEV